MIEFTPVPFEEAINFFRSKVPLTSAVYRQLTDEARARAFTVSGVARMDVLTDLYAGIDRAIAEGTTFQDFRKTVKEIMARRGWEGMSPYRLDTIFRTNIQGAYQAGHYAQQMELAERRPYWQYVAVMDDRVRSSHAAMNGKVVRYDDPFWKSSYPPNGFNCRCTVRSLSQNEFERERHSLTRNPGSVADPGFDTNPGESMGKTLTDEQFAKLQSDPKRWTPLIRKTFEDYGRPSARKVKEYIPTTARLWPRGEKAIDLYKSSMAGDVLKDPLGDPLILNDVLIEHFRLDGREQFIPLIADVVEHPYEIWLQAEKEKGTARVVLRKRYISFIDAGKGRPMLLVAESYRGQWIGYTVFYTRDIRYIDGVRNGALLYGK